MQRWKKKKLGIINLVQYISYICMGYHTLINNNKINNNNNNSYNTNNNTNNNNIFMASGTAKLIFIQIQINQPRKKERKVE